MTVHRTPPTMTLTTIDMQLVNLWRELERHRDHTNGDWGFHIADACLCLDQAVGHLLRAIGARELAGEMRADPRTISEWERRAAE
jgi:hypothetical protein